MGEERSELRLALGMRGGVSLAVWIGGACSEIDLLRRGGRTRASEFWRDVIGVSEYGRVVVDVLAGASAGGLNAVLYASSQVYDFPYSSMRGTWLELGGTKDLVRRAAPWPSLFRGDEYFLASVHQRLTQLIADRPHRPSDPPALDLRLSATLVEPLTRPMPSPADEDLCERRSRSGFAFRSPPEAWSGTDFPDTHATPGAQDRALQRLALAARATSSFPVAFEAAAVRSPRPPSFADDARASVGANPVDMAAVFLDRRNGDGDRVVFPVADGGIIDNIPLGRALDAVASAPADGPTRRVLVYLQPGSPSLPAAVRDAPLDQRRSTVAVLRGLAQARIEAETIAGDIAQLEAHNEAVARAAAIRRRTLGTGRTSLVAAARGAWRGYVSQRADEDARLITSLLEDPLRALGRDPFPATVAGLAPSDDRWRSPVAAWTPGNRQALRTVLTERFLNRFENDELDDGGIPADDVIGAGVRPLVRVTNLLLEWARYLESRGADVGEEKARLYRVLTFTDEVLEQPRRFAWVAAVVATDPPAEPSALLGAIAAHIDVLARVDPRTAVKVCRVLRTGVPGPTQEPDPRGEVHRHALEAIDDVVERVRAGMAIPPSGPRVDLRLAIAAKVLLPTLEALRTLDPPSAALPDHPAHLLHEALTNITIIGTPGRRDCAVLAALEVMCFPEFAAGLPCRRPIEFVRLSSANRTPLAPHFGTLMAAADADGRFWEGDARKPDQAPEGIHVDLKLAGNELANFSAFLRSEWRANDWLWGRLDAVPTLIDLLVRPEPLRSALQARRAIDPASARAAVRELVAPTDSVLHGLLATKVWTATVEALVGEELDALLAAGADEIARVSLPALRNALIARRQWEILAEELALTEDPELPAPPPPPPGELGWTSDADVVEKVAAYGRGVETVTRPPAGTGPALRERFTELTDATAEAVTWNLPLALSPAGRSLPRPLTYCLRASVRHGGRWATRRIGREGPSSDGRGTRRALVAVAVMAIVAVALLGIVINTWAFAIGLVLGAVLTLPVAVLAYRRLRAMLAREVLRGVADATSGRPSPSEQQEAPAAPAKATVAPLPPPVEPQSDADGAHASRTPQAR